MMEGVMGGRHPPSWRVGTSLTFLVRFLRGPGIDKDVWLGVSPLLGEACAGASFFKFLGSIRHNLADI